MTSAMHSPVAQTLIIYWLIPIAQRRNARQAALRKIVALSVEGGIPTLAFSSALAYYDAYRSNVTTN